MQADRTNLRPTDKLPFSKIFGMMAGALVSTRLSKVQQQQTKAAWQAEDC